CSSDLAVMYLGKIVELSTKEKLFEKSLHPYTRGLLSAIPIPDPELRTSDRKIIEGDIPSPENPPTGCNFHTRCPFAKDICRTTEPEFEEKEEGRFVACHFTLFYEIYFAVYYLKTKSNQKKITCNLLLVFCFIGLIISPEGIIKYYIYLGGQI